MKYAITILVLLFTCGAMTAQDTKIDASGYAEEVETPPAIVGGIQALSKNIVYPEAAMVEGVQGTVFVEVLLSASGSIDATKSIKSPSPLLTDAAIEAVRKTRFTPGKVDGKAVKTKLVLPIKFALH